MQDGYDLFCVMKLQEGVQAPKALLPSENEALCACARYLQSLLEEAFGLYGASLFLSAHCS